MTPPLVERIRTRAAANPDAPAFAFLDGDGESERWLSIGALDRNAAAIGAWLRDAGLEGERALLAYEPGLEFVIALAGCLYAGVVAVPAPAPEPWRLRTTLPRLRVLADDARPAVVLSRAASYAALEAVVAPERGERRAWLATDAVDADLASAWRPPREPDGIALLQYTSGTTASPKGVLVSHENLSANAANLREAFSLDERTVMVSWLPAHHDMGLIGCMLQPLHDGFPCLLTSPFGFVRSPERWLAAISRFRATASGGPNFAYDLCVDRIPPERRRAFDLSSWKVAFNGSEPVRHDTLERFAAAFAPAGFDVRALRPSYGLAEATLGVSAGAGGGYATFARRSGAHDEPLVGTGPPLPSADVRVVDDAGRECAPGRAGEIWVAGPSVACGYWARPEATDSSFGGRLPGVPGRFLRTGDAGFVADGELVVTGRVDDLMVVDGRNHHPDDVERTVERATDAVRRDGCAAFDVETGGRRAVVVAAELDAPSLDAPAVAASIRRAIAEWHDLPVHEVALVRRGRLPRTASGKIRRRACRSAYLAGSLAGREA